LLVLITGGGLGWIMYRARVQRDAVAAIQAAGGFADYDWDLTESKLPDFDVLNKNRKGVSGWRKWVIDRIDPDYVGTIRSVKLLGPGDADPIMPYVAQLPGLEELYIGPAVPLSDAGIAHLRGLTHLKFLYLPNTDHGRITGAGLKHISGLRRLQRLSLRNLPLSDAELAPIRELTGLRTLDGLSPTLTDAGIANLSPLANLTRLDLSWTRITSAGLVHLRGMSQLRVLNLEGTRVTDAGLPTLAELPALPNVRLLHSQVTEIGLANFRKDRRAARLAR
jgi:hypothetical protein